MLFFFMRFFTVDLTESSFPRVQKVLPSTRCWLPGQTGHDMEVSINGSTPIAGWFIRENPIKMDDLGEPQF